MTGTGKARDGGWRRFPSTAEAMGGTLFVPKGKGALSVVVALHGCNQNAGDFAMGTRLHEHAAHDGFAVLFPETDRSPATIGLNPFGCWVWWARENQGRFGEPARIMGLLDAARAAEPRLSPDRIGVTGLSSGAAMAAILAAVYPDRVAAFAAHAGVAYAAAELDTPAVPSWFRGKGPSGQDLLTFSPLNMMKVASWAKGSLSALEQAPDSGEKHADSALKARAGAAGRVPGLVVQGEADPVVDKANARQLVLQTLQIADLVDDGADDQSVDTRADAKAEGKGGTGGYPVSTWDYHDDAGGLVTRLVRIGRLGHAWSGGCAGGSFTDPEGPDASALTLAFFREVGALPPQARQR